MRDIELYDVTVTRKDFNEKEGCKGSSIDYDDPEQVINLMAEHLAKIFMATHKQKIEKELDRLKTFCKLS